MKNTQRRKKQRPRQGQGRIARDASVAPPPAPSPGSGLLGGRSVWLGLGLVALILLVYAPVRHYGFVDLDDPQYVSENPFVANGVTWSAVKWAFTSVHASYWLPLIWISHMIDVQLYGLDAGGHHVTNVLLHAANAILLFVILKRTTGATGRSAFVAALFAIHPLHVESVVWVTERKDVLSTLFLLLTIWTYVEYVKKPVMVRYALPLLFFVLGLMSKAMLVTLPFMLLLLDVWPLQRVGFREWPLPLEQRASILRLVREKIPFFVLAIIGAIVTYLTQQTTGAVASTAQIPIALRAGNAMVSYVTYLAQTLWPTRLALFYPYPRHLSAALVAACIVAIVVVTAFVVRGARTRPYLAVGWLWYLGSLVPVIGFIQAGDQARADRFTYVPLIGVFVMIAWGAYDLVRRPRDLAVVGALAVAAAAVMARVQVGYWRNNTVLWEHALRVTDESYVAHTDLGLAVYARGKVDSAITEFRAALRLRPDFAEAYNDLGVALANRGDRDGAIDAFLNALRAKPSQAPSHYNAAVLLAGKGDTAAARTHLELALQIDPDYADARRELERLGGGTARH